MKDARAGNHIVQKGVTYADHGTFLWGAQAWIRDEPGTGANDHSGNRGRNGRAFWLGDESKRFLSPTEIFDWLLELPVVFGNANFGIFSGGYDFGQALHPRGMPRHTIWEICKALKFKEAGDDSDPEEVRGYTWWHPRGSPRHYGIKYLKGKFFSICLLDPNSPGKGGKSNYLTKTTIYDVFGFFQGPLLKVVKSLLKNGYAEQWEYDLIEKNKALRGQFDNESFADIKEYCSVELSCTS